MIDGGYTIDEIFDPTSPFYNGAVILDTPPSAQSSFTDALNPASLAAGEIQGNTTVTDGYLQSENYVASTTGWRLTPTSGDINFNLNVQQITIGTSGYVRGGATDYLTGTGFFLGYSGAAYKFSVGNPAGNYIAWDGVSLLINGYAQTTTGTFGGDGSDGALAVSSGTTNIDLGNSAYVVKNYTSISITGTGAIKFINPHANGTVIILKSQGNVTLTSSAAPMIDASGCGAAGGGSSASSGTGSSGTLSGNAGNNGLSYSLFFNAPGGAAGFSGSGSSGPAGALPTVSLQSAGFTATQLFNKYQNLWTAAGSASGSADHASSTWSATTGAGGFGGGTLIIECAGAWNFTTANGVSVAGTNGGNGVTTGGTVIAGGGGGGAGGYFLALYNTLTANSGTVNVAGGTGGLTSKIGGIGGGPGGGSGANAITVGNAGSVQVDGVKSGGDGPAGASLITQNTYYA
jgi:hypothetical protein